MTAFKIGDRVTVTGVLSDDNFNVVPAPNSGRTGVIVDYAKIRHPESYDDHVWLVEFGPGDSRPVFEDWLQHAKEGAS